LTCRIVAQQQNKTCKGIRKSWEFLNEKGVIIEKMNDDIKALKNRQNTPRT
jgi:hypothetical protein